jgi:thiosulfate/3-mercaptopyruvate sulfurtransferase
MTNYRQLIDVAELQGLIAADDCRVIDCRFDLSQPEKGRAEYLAGHIPGAVFADLDRDLAGPVTESSGRHPLPDPEVFKATLEGFGIDANTQVVVYDYASGALAARLWWMLRWFGHSPVAVLNGGLKAWLAGPGTLETDGPEYPASELSALPDAGRVATTAEINATISEGRDLYLVDARDRPRFDGQAEPIDAVAGHIPGALNFPFSDNINAEGTWKSAEQLRLLWAALFDGDAAPPFSVMCGSGVTACHLVLSAEIAGLDEPRVYVGSWSEWIRDASRPVAAASKLADMR